MASNEAQQEFDELMRSKERRQGHPEDDHSTDQREVQQRSVSKEDAVPRPSMSSTRDFIPRTRYGANTGPKGVISDAQNFRDARREHRSAARASTTIPPEPALTFGQQQHIDRLVEHQEENKLEEESDDDAEDDEFMAQWRQQRLQALQQGGYSNSVSDKPGIRKTYGTMSVVDGEGYLEAIDGSESSTVVVVYISDDTSEVSQLFEECLRILASRHRDSRFIKLDFREAEIQAAGVPGLIAYRGGQKFAALIPLLDEMPDDGDLDSSTLEKVLQK